MDSPLYEILTIVGIFGAYKFGKYEGINQKIKEEADNAEEKTESNEEKLFNLVSAAAKNVTLDKPSFRNELGNTSDNKNALINKIKDPDTVKVTLFATKREVLANTFETNLPLVVALVETNTNYLLFDGNFLNAVRTSRFYEVRSVLDEAIQTTKVAYCSKPVEYTRDLHEDLVVKYLINESNNSSYLLTADSGRSFFAILSNITEKELSSKDI